MRIYDIIKQKRDNGELSEEQIQEFISQYTNETITDYQASALVMAMFINGLNKKETVALTKAMMNSGEVVDLSSVNGAKVDKHSTGGVGDTTTLVLAPLVAAAGVKIAKMSGRGLGHTGGTVDKLSAIPNFKLEMDGESFLKQVNEVGIAVIGQSKNIAPADKKLYALRDVTATVENISLIASSIMSKKLAAGADGIVLDVKTGSGAFIKDLDGSIELAKAMVDIGDGMNRETIALITDMSQPLGMAIGNSLEVIEAIETLKGKGAPDLLELCLHLGANMLLIAKKASDYDEAKKILEELIANGKAIEKMAEFIAAQGGDKAVIEDYSLLPQAKNEYQVLAKENGYVQVFHSEKVGVCALNLGAGRVKIDDDINLGAGIVLNKKIGDKVEKGELLATLYTDLEDVESIISDFENALVIGNEAKEQPLILARVTADKIEKLV